MEEYASGAASVAENEMTKNRGRSRIKDKKTVGVPTNLWPAEN